MGSPALHRTPGWSRESAIRHLGCRRATSDARRPARAPPRWAGAALRAAAGRSGSDRRRLWGEPRRALRQRDHRARQRPAAGGDEQRLRVVTAQPLPTLDPAFANTRQSRAIANAALHAARALRRCPGPAGDGDRAGPGARPAGRLARQPHVPRAAALGPSLRGWQAPDDAGRARHVRAPARPGDRLAGRRALPRHRWREDVRRGGGCRTCAGCARAAGRSRSRSSAPIRRSWRASPCRSRAPSRAARPTGRCPGLLARDATGRYRVVEQLLLADRSAARDGRRPACRAAVRRVRRPASPSAPGRRRRAAEAAIGSGAADLSLDDLPGRRLPALAVPVERARGRCASIRRSWPLSDEECAGPCRWRSTGGALAQADGGDVVAARSLLLDPLAPQRAARRIRRRPARCCARAGAEGTLRLELWAEPGAQARVAQRDRRSTRRGRGTGDVQERERSAAARRARGPGSSGSTRPTATRRRSSCRSPMPSRKGPQARAREARRAARHGSPAMRAGRPSGASTSASAQGAWEQFRCCVQTFPRLISSMLVGRGTHPVFDIDLALLSTRP